jgi:hypothetical protein
MKRLLINVAMKSAVIQGNSSFGQDGQINSSFIQAVPYQEKQNSPLATLLTNNN